MIIYNISSILYGDRNMSGFSKYDIVGMIFEGIWMPISLNVMISKKISWIRRFIFTLISILDFFLALLFGLNEWNNVVLVLMIALTLYYVLDRRKIIILLGKIIIEPLAISH